MRLVNAEMLRDKLKEVAHDRFNLSEEYGWFLKGLIAADDEIRWFPDAKEIVCCGECKHRRSSACPLLASVWTRSDDDFCSRGERKEE